MALSRSERISLASTITFSGTTAVGKNELSAWIAPALDKSRIITGNVYRAFGLLAQQNIWLDSGEGDTLCLTRLGEHKLLDLFASSGRRILFVPDSMRGNLAQLHIDGINMTEAIRPKRHGLTTQQKLEPAAATIATIPIIRHEVDRFLRKTAIVFGGPVMIAKNVDDFVPEAHRKYVLVVTDPQVSAEYRMIRGVSATGSYGRELDWLKARDALHEAHGLERLPEGARTIDMTNLLTRRGGMAIAASIIFNDLVRST